MKTQLLRNHCFTGTLSCFLLGGALILLFVEGKSPGTVVALLLMNSLVLTFMLIRTLLFPEQVPNLILADCDGDGIPVKIYEVCASDLLNFCCTEYDLEYGIDHWRTPEDIAIQVIKANHPNTIIFYSIGELAKWSMTSPLEKREAIRMKIDDFLRRRSRS